jgi:hypothetical protein
VTAPSGAAIEDLLTTESLCTLLSVNYLKIVRVPCVSDIDAPLTNLVDAASPREFVTVMRGYDRNQVDEHIRLTDAEARQHRDQARAMRQELPEAHRQIHQQERRAYSGLGAKVGQLLRRGLTCASRWPHWPLSHQLRSPVRIGQVFSGRIRALGRIWWIIVHQKLPGTRILPDLPAVRHTSGALAHHSTHGYHLRDRAEGQAWLKRKLRSSSCCGWPRTRPPTWSRRLGQKPACSAGQGACPPEDSGGAYGFAELKEVLAAPPSGTCTSAGDVEASMRVM